jgi:hypothetical protein
MKLHDYDHKSIWELQKFDSNGDYSLGTSEGFTALVIKLDGNFSGGKVTFGTRMPGGGLLRWSDSKDITAPRQWCEQVGPDHNLGIRIEGATNPQINVMLNGAGTDTLNFAAK